MIKLIGLKRIIVLVSVVALNLLALGVYMFSVGPMLDSVQSQKSSLQGQISGLHGRINGVKRDMVYMKKNLPEYQMLQKNGFFQSLDRFAVSDTMEKLRDKTGVSRFAYHVGKVSKIANNEAASIHYNLIGSQININRIVSPLDSNIYLLAQDMNHIFPSFVRLQSMEVHRTKKVDAKSLQDIANGQSVSFVSADLKFEAISLIPEPKKKQNSGGFRRQ